MIYQYNCVSPSSLEELEYVIENNESITVEEFKAIIGIENFAELEAMLGYNDELKLEDDWHVTYHSGKLPDNTPFAFVQHSCIEYIYY